MTADGAVFECRIGAVVRCGRAVSLQQEISPKTVAAAVRADHSASESVTVSCPEPTALHRYVGCLRPAMGLRVRTALANAGRSRGLTTPVDDELTAARESLESVSTEAMTLDAHRETVAAAATTLDRERERVAYARGRLQERQEQGANTEPAQTALDEALQTLTEAETDAIAATQNYDSAREQLRKQRTTRERMLELEDEVANLERRARAHLVEQLRAEYRSTLGSVPGSDSSDERLPDGVFDADPVRAGLAIARLGQLSAPVVVAVDRFESPAAASEWLDAPVVHI